MQQEADVLIRLEEKLRAEAKSVIQKAEAQASAIRKQAEKESEAILAEARAKAEAKLAQIRARRKSQATLVASQMISKVKAEAVNEAFKLAGTLLENQKGSGGYKKILENFLAEALDALKPSKGPFHVISRRDDEATLKDLLNTSNVNATIETIGHFSGGIEVIDEKSHIRVVNTFESRLRQGREAISDHIRKVLHV